MITDVQAYHASKKDPKYLQDTAERLNRRLRREGMIWEYELADAGYSSGESYAYLENKSLASYIPQHDTYKVPKVLNIKGKTITGPQGKKVSFGKKQMENGNLKENYFTTRADCIGCPMKQECIGKSHEKRINITAYREEYDRNIERVKSSRGRYRIGKHQSTM